MDKEVLEVIENSNQKIKSLKSEINENIDYSVNSVLYSVIEQALIAFIYSKTNKLPNQTLTVIKLAKEAKLPSKFTKILKEITEDEFTVETNILGYSRYDSEKHELQDLINESEEIIEWIEDEIKNNSI